MLAPWKKSYDRPRQHIKKQKHYFADKGPSSQSYIVSSSHVRMWELDHEESWVLKNSCFWTVVLEKTLESALYCKKITPLHPKGYQSSIFIGRTWWSWSCDTLATWCEELMHWERHARKDWRWEEKGTTEGEMVAWHHWLHGHEFEQALGVGDGQWGLACWDSWGCKESDTTERLIWSDLIFPLGLKDDDFL